MTARLLMALIQNGAAMPATATITPPSAGPTARLTLKPTSGHCGDRANQKSKQQQVARRCRAHGHDRCK